MEQQLVILLVKLAVAASLASILARSGAFLRMLMREDRTLPQRVKLALAISAVVCAGIGIRILSKGYAAVDLQLEGCLLAGILGGYVTGLLSGVLIAIPCLLHHEYLAMPFLAGIGTLGGLLRDLSPSPEEVWRFTPFLDLSLYRLLLKRIEYRRALFHVFCTLAIVFAEVLRFSLARAFGPSLLFTLYAWPDPNAINIAGVFLTTLFAITLPLKIWNNSVNERKLEAQGRLLTEARLAALTTQINPHFLFNTLNSVSSLIRTNPDKARTMIYKLSNILRRLLRKHENMTPLRDELGFIDDYLAIEMVRFGDQLKFEKDIDPDTVDRLVPSMMLQPLVENSIKHGLSKKIGGGRIRLKSRLVEGRLQLIVEDNGLGIPESRLASLFDSGIGVSNVNARLKVLFGNDYRMSIDSKPGEGTRTEIDMPALSSAVAPVAAQ
jgi:two-component system LytT family sensor kinase